MMLAKCLGAYCGRVYLSNNSISECSACPIGTRSVNSYPFVVNSTITSQCVDCFQSFQFYDWFYLSFNALFLLVIEWFINDHCVRRRNLPIETIILHTSAFLEIILSSLLTLLSFSTSFFSLTINFCGAYKLSDWYTLFYNPSPNFGKSIRCTQEAVYPLYSMTFLFYLFAFIFLIILRPWVVRYINDPNASNTICLTLYVVPAMVICHAIFSGFIYYSFPYISLIGSVISIACHFSLRLDQNISSLFFNSFENARTISIIFVHWFLHAFGIISFIKMKNLYALLLVPMPSFFYILTSKFTDPRKLHIY